MRKKKTTKKVKSVFVFANGNVAVFDEKGQQIPELQESLYNYKVADKLAKVIIRDNPEFKKQKDFPPLEDYLNFYRKHPELLK